MARDAYDEFADAAGEGFESYEDMISYRRRKRAERILERHDFTAEQDDSLPLPGADLETLSSDKPTDTQNTTSPPPCPTSPHSPNPNT